MPTSSTFPSFLNPHFSPQLVPIILSTTILDLHLTNVTPPGSIPVTPALSHPTSSIPTLRAFASSTGYPIMIKAVDGGGGRGIRLVRTDGELAAHAARAIEESPSRQVYAEKAMVDGFRHVEVQIVGDGEGEVRHLWERECSVQRRWQKVVEEAPSTVADREVVGRVIAAAVGMAERVSFFFLVSRVGW